MAKFRLISHKLCPYVQRAVIVASEKGVAFERVDIDLSNKPEWFLEISPTGKTPLLEVTAPDETVTIIFESAVIAEFLDEISPKPLLPADPLHRARHRSWVEFASATLNSIGNLYSAPDETAFEHAQASLRDRLAQVERQIAGPWFDGQRFGLVDAAFGPALRYLQVFRAQGGPDLLTPFPKTNAWSRRLLRRSSIRGAVSHDYANLLVEFVGRRHSHLAGRLQQRALAA